MPDGPVGISLLELALASSLLLANGAVSLWLRLGLGRQLLVAGLRTVVQLSLLGFVLLRVFEGGEPWLVLVISLAMVVLASVEAEDILPGDLGPNRVYRLRNHPDPEVAAAAEALLAPRVDEGAAALEAWVEGNLGTLLKRQLLREQLWQRPTLVIGTDLPDLNPQDLHHAVTHLQQCDLVLGPAADGGYWLIGLSRRLMRSPECWPLSGIPWGGPDVCRRTLEAAERRGHATALLQHRSDIDHLRDLRPWLG